MDYYKRQENRCCCEDAEAGFSIVRLYGIAFTSGISLVSEYVTLGPLDQYLREKKGIVKTVDLIEAASSLASALWHLTENNIVHGKIRCRKLLVSLHDENSFTVKLADPGIHTEYISSENAGISIHIRGKNRRQSCEMSARYYTKYTTLGERIHITKSLAKQLSLRHQTASVRSVQSWLLGSQDLEDGEDVDICDMSNIFPNLNISTATTSLDSLNSMLSIFELDGNCNVVLQGRIGQGFYGEVYKGTLEYIDGEDKEPRKVAVKKLKATAKSSCLQDFEREINIMKGMDYLGKKSIVHRDLAARNILVVDENLVKISDFGLAQVMGTNDYYILKTPNRELPIKWYAPESLRDGKFSVRSDVWSYGVTLCEMFNYGEEPNLTIPEEEMEGPQQQILLQALEKGARFPCPPKCSNAIYVRIIRPCWQAESHLRPPFCKLIEEVKDLLNN
nr:unnamed protein product [Callosobruchus analis]